MNSDKAFCHQRVPFVLEKQNRMNKRMSKKAVVGLVLYGRRFGGYDRYNGHRILSKIQEMRRQGNLIMPNWLFDEIELVVIVGAWRDSKKLYGILMDMPQELSFRLVNKNRIIVTEDMDRGLEVLASFKHSKTKEPLYVDTEKSHHWLRGGNYRELALVTVFDAGSRRVLLFRVHRFDEDDLKYIQDQICALSKHRTFASYGSEDFFSISNGDHTIEVQDLQDTYDDGCQVSLKSAAKAINTFVDKEETLSDWTAPRLTNDQVQYAAMDAVVLRELPDPAKCSRKLVCPFIHQRPSRPSSSHHSRILRY